MRYVDGNLAALHISIVVNGMFLTVCVDPIKNSVKDHGPNFSSDFEKPLQHYFLTLNHCH